ncbi:KI13B protein, partial [Nyctiprogne leucopyga]|nr:KI13B protein [Nyctiprogne leucopyga]
QGQSRRIQVEVRSVQESGTLPLMEESILSVGIGCVQIKHVKSQKVPENCQEEEDEMDSYQDRDLERLRRKWLCALTKRQEYLDQQLQKLVGKPDKTEDDADREAQLLEMRLTLTEERNAVMVPSAGSGIPGAPAEWTPVPGMETHIPVIFLDLNDRYLLYHPSHSPSAPSLSLLEEGKAVICAICCCCDSLFSCISLHLCLNGSAVSVARVKNLSCRVIFMVSFRVWMIMQLFLKAQWHLSMRDLVLFILTPNKKSFPFVFASLQGFAQSFLRRMSHRSSIPGCGVTFEIVSNIPEDAQGAEEREALARMAANVEDAASADSEAYIEKYLRSVLAVENILTLDRLRQEVAVKEQLMGKGKLYRRSLSSPNVNRLSGSRQDLAPLYNLSSNRGRWESQQDVSQGAPSSSRGISPSRTSLPGSGQQNHSPDPGLGSLAASYLNPVKSFVPQMPKLLKSLFPVRDEKKGRQTSPLAQQ